MYDGIIYFIEELKRCEAADAKMAAALMVFVGIDTMAFLGLPAGRKAQRKDHFIEWADRYMKADAAQSIAIEAWIYMQRDVQHYTHLRLRRISIGDFPR